MTVADERGPVLLASLGLSVEQTISEDGDAFVILKCRDRDGASVVLKYVSGSSPDACRRLANESTMLAALPIRHPMKPLPVREAGHGFLVTAFDPAVQLRPETMDQDEVATRVGETLAAFQTTGVDAPRLGIADRERLTTYYLKVLAKNLLHVWPALIRTTEAAHVLSVMARSMPAIGSARVICHGDFIPTNLLFDAATGSVTLTDLEGFMTANHPLFDALALCTSSERPLADWRWERQFLSSYVRHGRSVPGLDPRDRSFREAYRGILVFFLIWRLTERFLAATGQRYFDGQGKPAFVRKRLAALLGAHGRRRDHAAASALGVSLTNLRGALDAREFARHLNDVFGSSIVHAQEQHEDHEGHEGR